MTAAVPEHVRELLVRSLEAWRVPGDVGRDAQGALVLTAEGCQLRIARAADAGLPFRWMVTDGERIRGVASIAGLLRAVRTTVDPGYRPIRLRVAPLPLAPP
jgi:hypothetical protein